MIYLDNAATTLPKPKKVVEAVANAINSCGNPARGSHEASLAALRVMMRTRSAIAQIFNVPDPMDVAFTPNATAALNIAISGIKGHITTTAAEHNSVLRPLFRRGNYTVVPLDSKGRLSICDIESAIRPDTEAIVMCHASNLTGNVFDVRAVSELCASKGLRFILDAAQTAGLIDIDSAKLKLSALCFSGHKSLYGPQGIGGICLGQGFKPEPLVVGGSGSESFSPTHPAVMPDALEAGTQNAHGAAGLLAGIQYIKSLDGKAFSIANGHAKRFISEIKKVSGVTLYGDVDAELRTPVVALNVNGKDSSDIAALLWDNYEIAVRAGAHCAPLMHKTLGTEKTGAVRFSFSHFNTDEEIKTAITAVKKLAK